MELKQIVLFNQLQNDSLAPPYVSALGPAFTSMHKITETCKSDSWRIDFNPTGSWTFLALCTP